MIKEHSNINILLFILANVLIVTRKKHILVRLTGELNEHIKNHDKRDKHSYLLKNAHKNQYSTVWKEDFHMLNSIYRSYINRTINKVLYIR